MAMLMSLVALSVDAILPAMQAIGRDLSAGSPNAPQYMISALLLGLSVGQLFSGPLSDSFGRRPIIQAGLCLFFAGSLLSMIATNYETMLVGRFLQGVGAAGPRVVTIALVRDQFEGRAMARVMSFVMTVFILVPALAPALGQLIMLVAPWRMIFGAFLLLALIAIVWLTLRQPETHPPERHLPLRLSRIAAAFGECLSHPISVGYMVAAGFVFGSFVGFLTSVQQIFSDIFQAGDWFAAYFAVLALSIGAASMTNARMVMRLGMLRLSVTALIGLLTIAVLGLMISLWSGGAPSLPIAMAILIPIFFCFGVLFGNFNAQAMQPMGHIAGSASAVIAATTSLIAVSFGTYVGQRFDGTLVPLFTGFVIASLVAGLVLLAAETVNARRHPLSGTDA